MEVANVAQASQGLSIAPFSKCRASRVLHAWYVVAGLGYRKAVALHPSASGDGFQALQGVVKCILQAWWLCTLGGQRFWLAAVHLKG